MELPIEKDSEQSVPQFMPDGELVTVPFPTFFTVRDALVREPVTCVVPEHL
jgi:hypothetical protein